MLVAFGQKQIVLKEIIIGKIIIVLFISSISCHDIAFLISSVSYDEGLCFIFNFSSDPWQPYKLMILKLNYGIAVVTLSRQNKNIERNDEIFIGLLLGYTFPIRGIKEIIIDKTRYHLSKKLTLQGLWYDYRIAKWTSWWLVRADKESIFKLTEDRRLQSLFARRLFISISLYNITSISFHVRKRDIIIIAINSLVQ